jgi:RND family efflux transporter MFP subunit
MFSGPEVKKQPSKRHLPLVEIQALDVQTYTIKVRSSGKVRASTQTKLIAEVSGRIIKRAKNFQDGAYFKKGEILLQIDDADFINTVTVAESEVQQKLLQLQEEYARAKVAKKDWRLLDSENAPSELVTRQPHITTAKSNLAAAKARLRQAKRNLERTYIRVPYSGQVLSRSVDVGQYVSIGTVLGEVYAKQSLEVHLPVSLRQYKQLALNENPTIKQGGKVEFYMVQGKRKSIWAGHVLRSSAALDANTNQLNITARIKESKQHKIKIGQFVRANIYGQVYSNVYIVPRSAVRQNKEVFLVQLNDSSVKDSKEIMEATELMAVPIEVLHTEGNKSVIRAVITKEQRLAITPMPLASSGLRVRVKLVKEPE